MTRIQVRRDTSANWASVNPTPAEGEPCFETDTGKLKIGNGQQPYNSLPYQTAEEIPVATTSTTGLVKPDGTTITITPDGTISSVVGNFKYVVLTSTEYTSLTPNPDTMYRLTDTNKVYLGIIELTGGGGGSTGYGNVEVNNISITSKFKDYTEGQ